MLENTLATTSLLLYVTAVAYVCGGLWDVARPLSGANVHGPTSS
jgi:hypothetical protein